MICRACSGRNWLRGKWTQTVFGRVLPTGSTRFELSNIWTSTKIRRGWVQYLFKPRPGECHPSHSFYRRLYPSIIKDIDVSVMLWYQDVKNSFKEMTMKYNDQLCRPLRTTGGVASTTSSESTAEARTAKEFTASSTTTPRSSPACGTTPSRCGTDRYQTCSDSAETLCKL